MNPPKHRENSITRYSIKKENLVGIVKENIKNYDLMTTIMICLGKPESKDYTGILKLLDILLSTETSPKEKCQILEYDFKIEMTQTLESEVSLMCNLSKGVEEKGIEKGKIYGAISMCWDLNLSEEIIIEKLQKKFHLSEKEAKEYLKLVE